MAGANDVAGSDNANPQLVIVFVHKLRCELRLTASSMARSTLEEYGFPAVEFKIYGCPSRHSLEDHPLDQSACTRQVTQLFSRHESLSHHRIKSHARQRHSPAWFGQEKRRRRPAHHQNGAAHFRAKFASPAHLGAGTQEVCARPCYCPWS